MAFGRPWVLAVSVAAAFAAPAPSRADVNAMATEASAIGRFTTSYAHDTEHKARATNIEIAAAAIDGKNIAAGGTFSFNDAAIERTRAFGYERSIVLRDGMIAEGSGGGACQVASTLHAAALLAGLDIVMRAPHSRPSAYIRMGLDATVSLGSGPSAIDLKLKNPTRFPMTLRARAARGTLDVWIDSLGRAKPTISVTSEIVERIAFPRIVEHDASVPKGIRRIREFGIPGYRVKRTREVRTADSDVKRDVRIDVYPPTREVVREAPPDPDSGETHEDNERATTLVDAGAIRPSLVQLRPSTRVVLDNGADVPSQAPGR